MATYRVTVEIVDAYNRHRTLLAEHVKTEPDTDDEPRTSREVAIEVLKLVDGAECPYDCDTCRED